MNLRGLVIALSLTSAGLPVHADAAACRRPAEGAKVLEVVDGTVIFRVYTRTGELSPSGTPVVDETIWACRRSIGRTVRVATAARPAGSTLRVGLERPTAEGALTAVVRETTDSAADGSGSSRLQVLVRSSRTGHLVRVVTVASVSYDARHPTTLYARRLAVGGDGRTLVLVRVVNSEVREEIRGPAGELVDRAPAGVLTQVRSQGGRLTWRHDGRRRRLPAD